MNSQYKYTTDPRRRSGRTVMLALNYVHIVLDTPGEWVTIEDHAPTLAADRNLFVLVCRVLNELGVLFDADKVRFAIKSTGPLQPYEYPEAEEIMLKESAHQHELQRTRNRNFIF